MSPNPPRLRRRLGHGGISLLVLATSSSLLWTASSGTASAAPVGPQPVCADGTCTVSFKATGELQTWTVPAGITSLSATVAGASGGNAVEQAFGGSGGRTTGTFAVEPGDALAVVVGVAGRSAETNAGAAATYGGGGPGGSGTQIRTAGTSGGGASFLYDSTLLLAAGGGGGASGGQAGGAGGGSGAAAGAGTAGVSSSAGQPGTTDANGAGGTPSGQPGTGDAIDAATLPAGGQGGFADPFVYFTNAPAGGGGGGGFHAGGGGGGIFENWNAVDSGSGGGGGAGFAAASVTDPTGTTGVQAGDGTITLTYANIPAYTVSFTSSFDGAVVGAKSRNVSAETSAPSRPTFSVDPATTNSACTVDGVTVSFDHVGTCVIAGDVVGDETHTAGHNTLSFVIGQGNQTITFGPLPTTGTIGDVIPLVATASTASGSPIVFSLGAGSAEGVCAIDNDAKTLTLTAAGRCVVLASQAGTADYKAAGVVNHEVAVSLIATTSALTFDQKTPVYGQQVTATVTVTGASTAGFVQFSVDGRPLGDRVSVALDGTASIALPDDLGAGGHPVKATFTPLDITYAESSVEQSLPVAQAKTSTDLTVRANQASVVVTAVTPGAGTPEGTVVFSFGDTVSDPVTLVRGKATYDGTIPADTVVRVAYSGDDDFAESSTSTLRKNPTITTTVSSDAVKSLTGWYSKSVTVSFDCVAGSAPLTEDCPDPVTLSADGASQGVTKTIIAEDGGVATASVTGINIDTTAPTVSPLFVREGDRFFSTAPEAGCLATDNLSGVAACGAGREVDGKAVTYSVIAIDQAGNTTTSTVRASTYVRGIVDAPYVDGAYTVKAGQTVTLVAKSSKRPQLYKPVEAPKTPSKKGDKFKAGENDDEWALGYTVPTSLKAGKTYNLGIKTTSKDTIKIKVIA